jgi:endonuclease/exonuclease/phosphatase family metal-dependent hydrolase
MNGRSGMVILVLIQVLLLRVSVRAESFRVATYNLESYLDQPTTTRPAKSAESRAQIRQSIRMLNPDILALQEMGTLSALMELRDSLKQEGLDFRFWEYVQGFDTNIHLAVLSRFPITASRPHTNDNFVLGRRRFQVSRGFGEVEIQVNPHYAFTLITAHLKSKRTSADADEAEQRREEARLLREKIDVRLALDPAANLVVLGDFNDNQDAPSTKLVVGRGKGKLIDTRPAERNEDGGAGTDTSRNSRAIYWTHYYPKEDLYARIDYILLSSGMAREWVRSGTYIPSIAAWGVGSDHRPMVAAFEAEDK